MLTIDWTVRSQQRMATIAQLKTGDIFGEKAEKKSAGASAPRKGSREAWVMTRAATAVVGAYLTGATRFRLRRSMRWCPSASWRMRSWGVEDAGGGARMLW